MGWFWKFARKCRLAPDLPLGAGDYVGDGSPLTPDPSPEWERGVSPRRGPPPTIAKTLDRRFADTADAVLERRIAGSARRHKSKWRTERVGVLNRARQLSEIAAPTRPTLSRLWRRPPRADAYVLAHYPWPPPSAYGNRVRGLRIADARRTERVQPEGVGPS